METSCVVCCESYTSFQRRAVACPQCNYTACAACVRRYLVSQTEGLSCMACRKPWERSQLIDMLPKSFVHGGLTKWRKEILFERERGMMPATIPLIAAKRAVRDLAPLRHQVRAQLRACRNIYSTVAEINQSTTSGNYDPSSERHRLLLSRLETFG